MSTILVSRCSSSIPCIRSQPCPLFLRIHSAPRLANAHHLRQPNVLPSFSVRSFASKPRPLRKSTKSTPPNPLPRSNIPRSGTTTAPTTNYIPTQDLLSHTLANKPSPTLLYVAPTSNTFAITCLGVGVSCLSYGFYHFYDAFLVPHPGLWWLVPYMMGGVSIFMMGTGIWVGLGARRLVGSLSAVPVRVSRDTAGRAATEEAGLFLRVESKPILPFMNMSALEVPLSNVRLGNPVMPVAAGVSTFGSSLSAPGQQSSIRKTPQQLRRQAETKAALEKQEQTLWQVLTGPFRTIMRVGSSGIGRVVARDGFVSLYVQGKMWRLDAREGWLLDDGSTIDRLLKLR